MKRKYQMISFDLDDTLLKKDKTIPEATAEWIRRFQIDGGIVILASGRDISEMTEFMKQLGMSKGKKGYVISSSGAYLWDLKHDNVVEFPSFNAHEARLIAEALLEQNDAIQPMIVCKTMDYIVTLKPTLKDRLRFAYYRARGITRKLITPTEVESIKDHIEKVRIEKSSGTNYKDCLKNVSNAHYRLIEGHRVDYFHDGIDKSSGVKKAMEAEGLEMKDILIFGDDENDITCFEAFPNTVAMENAVQEIKNLAKYHTSSNEENGVLDFLIAQQV